jgi:hypothetical protein
MYGTLIKWTKFPLANAGAVMPNGSKVPAVQTKYALVINKPSLFGENAVVIELTTRGGTDEFMITKDDVSDHPRRDPSTQPYVHPEVQKPGATLHIKGVVAQLFLQRTDWSIQAKLDQRFIKKAWEMLTRTTCYSLKA